MAELRDMYDEVAPPSPQVLAEGRARLLTATREDGRRSVRPRRYRGLLAVALTGTVATATAAGAVAIMAQGSDVGGPREIQQVSARDVLTRAAAVARMEPELKPRPDQYLFTRSQDTWGPGAVTPGKPKGQRTRQVWERADGSVPGLLRTSCWRRPASTCDTPLVNEDAPKNQPVPAPGSYLWTVRELPKLLKLWGDQLNAPAPSPSTDPSIEAWSAPHDLVHQGYLPPRLRAQVFEFLADVPGVRVDENATDPLGRPGIALSKDNRNLRQELIFDRRTYRFLGSRDLPLGPRAKITDWTEQPEGAGFELARTILEVKVVDRLPT
ncbi:CU044_5270 family protein [Actinomadura viridis]|uniref:CU044_5270 family protein n=1 Tax=Actinomadura viridis TaxID=58110 RepID=UPI0036C57A5D